MHSCVCVNSRVRLKRKVQYANVDDDGDDNNNNNNNSNNGNKRRSDIEGTIAQPSVT
ncbi:uncharacterized protein K489DRAFT_381578 [Dissoconium aciculare CBS 342.82]|uniref:Uncharacterized protein n=1 Tax=Dissoconium aciculare CBS 342.82 TaxID=1314786 RepID=A0A6J3M130_9PEZI|nr:uncharacterized protein K489DRAFT_381578 [Dissoconium aciculare CBS 342.82]KAF1821583.1 hypothetical protein K489DRAFT_381578 [Dissoconium aciculare CBS 342.82]